MVADTRRIDRGRGHSYLLDGQKVDGVTWVTDNGIAKPAIINAAAKVTAGYAVDHWDELAELTLSARLDRLTRARWEIWGAAATRGTDIHKLAQRLQAGEEIDVPEELVGHVDAYLAFARDWEVQEILVECPVGRRTRPQYMGTPDLIALLADGKRWLLDWKTGSGIYPEFALQLAAYRYAEFVLHENGNEIPMPEVDEAGCVWLRADGYDLIPLDTSPEIFQTFQYAQQVARFTALEREATVGEALTLP